jgi:tryptophan synthase alpha chain
MKPDSVASPLTLRFDRLRARGRKALIPYLMSGFPSRRAFREIAARVLETAPDVLEIGVPFSDPLADGPVIEAAGQRSLALGGALATTLEDAAWLSARFGETPLVLMSYFNPLRAHGLERAARDSRRAGIAGWIVPDRDLVDCDEILAPAHAAGLDVVPLVAPTTPVERLDCVLEGAAGFVYVVSVTGVTGVRRGQRFALASILGELRRRTKLPLCVGFGISDGRQAREVARLADGVVVGSALLEPLLENGGARGRRELLSRLNGLRRGLDRNGAAR